MRINHSLHITLLGILQGESASLNGILKVENYHIARYLSTDQFSTTVVFFKGCNFVMELQKVSIFP